MSLEAQKVIKQLALDVNKVAAISGNVNYVGPSPLKLQDWELIVAHVLPF